MKLNTLIVSLLLVFSGATFAQSSKSIEEHGISKVQIFETDFEAGEKEKRVIEERFYDQAGNLVEFKEYSDEGKVKTWEKYSYNAQGKVTSESFFNAKGELKKKIEHIYDKGLKVEKRYYDAKERLTKTKYYDYDYHQ